MIIAIDPGPIESAFVLWSGNNIFDFGIFSNDDVISELKERIGTIPKNSLFIEMIACYGMPVGKETFETCVQIGRFLQAWDTETNKAFLVFRKDIKMHHCGSMRAKDVNVTQALKDKYGAKGTKKNPGVTYGLKSHLWAAFALATYASENNLG